MDYVGMTASLSEVIAVASMLDDALFQDMHLINHPDLAEVYDMAITPFVDAIAVWSFTYGRGSYDGDTRTLCLHTEDGETFSFVSLLRLMAEYYGRILDEIGIAEAVRDDLQAPCQDNDLYRLKCLQLDEWLCLPAGTTANAE